MPDTDGITLPGMAGSGLLTMPVVMMSGHGTIDSAVEGAHRRARFPRETHQPARSWPPWKGACGRRVLPKTGLTLVNSAAPG
jgi:hypothetical protein